jgi:transcriptional repressor NrdR
VERALATRADREVSTREIGDIALAELQAVDHVAYLRFASVYRAFDTPEDFLEVVKPLLRPRP